MYEIRYLDHQTVFLGSRDVYFDSWWFGCARDAAEIMFSRTCVKNAKGMEKMWCFTDTAGKFRAKHENQRRSKPNYVNTKVCNEASSRWLSPRSMARIMHLSIETPTPHPSGLRWGFDLTSLQILTNPHPTGAYWLVKPNPGRKTFVIPLLTLSTFCSNFRLLYWQI